MFEMDIEAMEMTDKEMEEFYSSNFSNYDRQAESMPGIDINSLLNGEDGKDKTQKKLESIIGIQGKLKELSKKKVIFVYSAQRVPGVPGKGYHLC